MAAAAFNGLLSDRALGATRAASTGADNVLDLVKGTRPLRDYAARRGDEHKSVTVKLWKACDNRERRFAQRFAKLLRKVFKRDACGIALRHRAIAARPSIGSKEKRRVFL